MGLGTLLICAPHMVQFTIFLVGNHLTILNVTQNSKNIFFSVNDKLNDLKM